MSSLEHERRFAEWTTIHAGIFHRVANAFARGGDRDDLMQELLIATWKAIPAFRGGSSPATFLYRVTHNAALTWKRSERTRREQAERFERLSVRDPDRAAELGPNAERTRAGTLGEQEERLQRVYAAIRELPEVDRSLLLLSLDGLAYVEMAAMHGLTVSNVGARLTRARQALTQRLEGELS